MNDSQLIKFYYNGSENVFDVEGRTFEGILSLSDEKLETVHSYVQWLFPLPEKSSCYKDAPILSKDDIEVFHKYSRLQDNMLKAFEKMLKFYGFELYYESNMLEEPRVVKTRDFAKKSKNWLTMNNHNFLRITRILRCLSLCGLKEEAKAFYEALKDICDNENPLVKCRGKDLITGVVKNVSIPAISEETMNYWQEAIEEK